MSEKELKDEFFDSEIRPASPWICEDSDYDDARIDERRGSQEEI